MPEISQNVTIRTRRKAQRHIVTAEVLEGETPRTFSVTGQTARCLQALVEAGQHGVTAQEVSSWALRFAAYCFDLRTIHGLTILTEREPHPGGWHGRHVLMTPVRIISGRDI